jgi:hypothetical protein
MIPPEERLRPPPQQCEAGLELQLDLIATLRTLRDAAGPFRATVHLVWS